MGLKVIVRVEEGTVRADGMLTVIVVVTKAVAVLYFSQLLSKPKKEKYIDIFQNFTKIENLGG